MPAHEGESSSSSSNSSGSQGRVKRRRRPKWKGDENNALVHGAHEESEGLRARFQGGSGGRERREAAWRRVASKFN